MTSGPHVAIDARLITAPGIGTYLRNLLPRIFALRPEWQYTLLGDPAQLAAVVSAAAGRAKSTTVSAPIYSIAEQFALARSTPRDADLFWAPHYNIPVFGDAPLLVTVHDVAHLVRSEYRQSITRRVYARAMFRAVARRARTILTVSEFTRREVLEHLSPKGTVVSIHNGVDPSWFGAARGAPPPRPYILWVGALKPHKNLPRVLEAFRSITSSIPHDLIVVGRADGFMTGDAQARAALGGGDRVRYVGEVDAEHLQSLMAGADVLVQASLYEGFGLTALEAMAAGCPVLAANAASLPEVCGDAAAYCDPLNPADIATQLAALLGDSGRRAQLSERGQLRARLFSWERAAAETVAAMDGMLRIH